MGLESEPTFTPTQLTKPAPRTLSIFEDFPDEEIKLSTDLKTSGHRTLKRNASERTFSRALQQKEMQNENEATYWRPRKDDRDFKPLPFRPSITVPVSPALMLTKRDARATGPIIRMDDDAGRWRICVRIVSVPADISTADDRG